MSKRLVLVILGIILAINLVVLGSYIISKQTNNNEKEASEEPQEQTESEEETNNTTPQKPEESNEDTNGEVPANGNYDETENSKALEKALENSKLMKELNTWIATNYEYKDITTKTYTVKKGDTLWEISEAYYGSGFRWKEILELNNNKIGFLPNGSQALIVPGQVLTLDK